MNALALTIKAILEKAPAYEWSLQGFGMLRLYLSKEVRLHVWNSKFAVPNVSSIHDHPWSFESEVVCGTLENVTYHLVKRTPHGDVLERGGSVSNGPDTHMMSPIRCGVGGGLAKACELGEPGPVRLVRGPSSKLTAGNRYFQAHDEIHESRPADGTVTLVTRKFRADTEHARVFYPLGTEWVSAEPRRATPDEAHDFVLPALLRLQVMGL